jgi:hypothetical protein
MENQGVFPIKSVISEAVLIALCQIILAYSIKVTWNIYKNFKK